ncbi:hypothetical protein Tco_0082498, partial [Tanacetum coccineum]
IPDINLDDNVKLQHLHYLLRLLIPFVKQFSKEQTAELVWEAKAQGVTTSSTTTKQSKKPDGLRVSCSFCSTSIVGLIRSCPKCDYEVCLTCCREIRNNQALQNVAEFGKCGKADNYWNVRNNIATFSKPVIKDNDITCPKCNNVLELMHTLENDWISKLEARANSILETNNPTYIEPVQLEDICGTNFKAASSRSGSDDNYLYCPVSKDVLEM